MTKYTLYTLTPWMEGKNGPYYCPGCAITEGFFVYSPEIKNEVEIISVDFQRPREKVVKCLGVENQECPVLVLNDNATRPEYAKKSLTTGKSFIDDPAQICTYLGKVFDCVKPHP